MYFEAPTAEDGARVSVPQLQPCFNNIYARTQETLTVGTERTHWRAVCVCVKGRRERRIGANLTSIYYFNTLLTAVNQYKQYCPRLYISIYMKISRSCQALLYMCIYIYFLLHTEFICTMYTNVQYISHRYIDRDIYLYLHTGNFLFLSIFQKDPYFLRCPS